MADTISLNAEPDNISPNAVPTVGTKIKRLVQALSQDLLSCAVTHPGTAYHLTGLTWSLDLVGGRTRSLTGEKM